MRVYRRVGVRDMRMRFALLRIRMHRMSVSMSVSMPVSMPVPVSGTVARAGDILHPHMKGCQSAARHPGQVNPGLGNPRADQERTQHFDVCPGIQQTRQQHVPRRPTPAIPMQMRHA